MELCGQVGDVGHTVQVSLQDVPTHLVVEWVAEFGWDLKEERAMGVIQRIHTGTDKGKKERETSDFDQCQIEYYLTTNFLGALVERAVPIQYQYRIPAQNQPKKIGIQPDFI